MKRVVVNGKFLSQSAAGVQRVASELVRALDQLSTAGDPLAEGLGLTLARPNVVRREMSLDAFAVSRVGFTRGVLWEQFELPRFVGSDLLVNLCNVGPLLHRRDVLFIHDAQPFITPQSYSWAFRTWYRTVLPILAARAHRIVTVSNYARDCLAHWGVAPWESIRVIHNGVDHARREPAREAVLNRLNLRGRRFVVAPANIQKHKNVPILFEAFSRQALGDTALVLLGSATAEDFKRIGATPPRDVTFAGRVEDGEMRAIIEHAAAFAFPSTTEGFGLPPLEAMLLGTPAVVSPMGALPELCGEAVIYADPTSADAWATALDRLLTEPDLRARYAAAGRSQAERYRWADSGRQLMALLHEAA